jgi:anaerobic selenocysteine-containing dehydrogenase
MAINPTDAEPRGIKDGDQVMAFNDRGRSILPAWVTERIMPGTVHIPEGGHYSPDEQGIDRGGCPNIFTMSTPSPGGAFPMNTTLVQVRKA